MHSLRRAGLLAAALYTVTFAARAQEHETPHEAPHEATHEPAHEEGHAAAGEHAGGHEHAHSPWEMRLSLESPIYAHVSQDGVSGSTNFTKTFETGFSVMLGYLLIPGTLGIVAEITESVLWASENPDESTPKRSGTTVRVGVDYAPIQGSPFYVTALIPFHLEPSPFEMDLRIGAGYSWRVPFGKSTRWFVEADVDFSLAGGTGVPNAFAGQAIVLATGLMFHVP
jgi:hypothetical protein